MIGAVEFKNVNFSYNQEKGILKNVSFKINYGEIILLSGESGSGKTSLLHLISGIIPQVTKGYIEGEILINFEKVDLLDRKISQTVGIVLQNAEEQIIHEYVEDEIAFGCENIGFKPEIIENQIDIVCKLLELNKKWKSRTLSGGQKQLLITATTLAMGAKILILDEPLANLDQKSSLKLLNILSALASAGYAIIISEHRVDLIYKYVNRIFQLEGGILTEISNKEEYLKSKVKRIEMDSLTSNRQERLFDIKNASFKVKNRTILEDISCEINKGEKVLLLGENGSGKTTFLRLLGRLSKSTKGEIIQYLDNKLGQKKSSKVWYNKVGIVYQNPDYQLFMPTVKDEILFNAKDENYAIELAKILDIYDLWDRHPHSLSEGQKRRVTIAAVLATKPEVLLLDEPTVGLDYQRLKTLIKFLNKINQELGTTIISITHDIRCAEILCDKALWIKDGKLYKSGSKNLVDEYYKLK